MVALLETSAPSSILQVHAITTDGTTTTTLKNMKNGHSHVKDQCRDRRHGHRRCHRCRRVHFASIETGEDDHDHDHDHSHDYMHDFNNNDPMMMMRDDEEPQEVQVFTYEAVRDEEKQCVYSSKKELKDLRLQTAVFAGEYAQSHPEWIEQVDSLILNLPLQQQQQEAEEGNNSDETGGMVVSTMLAESEARGLELSCSSLLQNQQEWATKAVLGRYRQLRLQQQQREQREQRQQQHHQTPPTSTSKHNLSEDDSSTSSSSSSSQQHSEDGDDSTAENNNNNNNINNNNNSNDDILLELLRKRCETVNKFSREMALKMGRGDELQARRVFAEEPLLRRWL